MHTNEFIDCYEVFVAIAVSTDDGMRETPVKCLYTAPSFEDALESAINFGEDRLLNLYHADNSLYADKNAFIACYKVYTYSIGPMNHSSGRGFSIFEWKSDFPGTLQDWIKSAIANHKDTQHASQ